MRNRRALLSNSDTLFVRELYSEFKEYTSRASGVMRAVNSFQGFKEDNIIICLYWERMVRAPYHQVNFTLPRTDGIVYVMIF